MLQHSALLTIWFKPVLFLHGLMLESDSVEALPLWESSALVHWCAYAVYIIFYIKL